MNFKDQKQELLFLATELESLPNFDEAQWLLGEISNLLKQIENVKKVAREKLPEFKDMVDKKLKAIQHDFDGIMDTLPESELK